MERLSPKEIRFILNLLTSRSKDLEKTATETPEGNNASEDLLLCNNLISFFKKEQADEIDRSKKEAAENFNLGAIKKAVNGNHNS